MSNKKQTIVAVASASMLVMSATPAFAVVADQSTDTHEGAVATDVASDAVVTSAYVEADAAEGTFTWNQSTITPNSVIKSVFASVTNALCNARTDFVVDNPLQWSLTVNGDVSNAYTVTVDELAQEEAVSQTMTCTCGGNPADGRAIITAEVKGLPVSYLVTRAGADSDVNTITFTSSDGTSVSMPLAYVVGHHAVISFEINGEDLSASVGGNNQLWLAGASANYFVRDIAEISITAEDEAPAAPGEDMDYPNSPNVGLLSSVSE